MAITGLNPKVCLTGTAANLPAVTPDLGVLAMTTDTKVVVVGDGITAGGIRVDAHAIRPKGTYDVGAAYVLNDSVKYGTSWWLCIVACTGVTPVEGANWTGLGGGGDTTGLLKLDQTNPQTFTGGAVTGTGLLSVTAGVLGLYSAASFQQTFTNADLVAGVLTVTHNRNEQYSTVTIVDNLDKAVLPDDVTYTSVNALTVDLSSFGALSGSWRCIVGAKTGTTGATGATGTTSGNINAILGDGNNVLQVDYIAVSSPITEARLITGWSVLETSQTPVAGSITFEILKSTVATYPVMTTIITTGYPTLSSQTGATGSTAGWSNSISINDIVIFKITAASAVRRVSCCLSTQKV